MALGEAGIEEVSLHTGQHYDATMSAIFYDELGLAQPGVRAHLRCADAELMRPAIAAALDAERPDWTLVFGDTNSTLAGALAPWRLRCRSRTSRPGLRSGDLTMPEERNRIEVDQLPRSSLPDERSRNARGRGRPGRVEVVGDVMADAPSVFGPLARDARSERPRPAAHYVVATVHREANVAARSRDSSPA